MNDLTLIIICAAALVLIIVAWVIAFKMGDASRKKKDEAEIGSAEAEAKRIIEAAKKEVSRGIDALNCLPTSAFKNSLIELLSLTVERDR